MVKLSTVTMCAMLLISIGCGNNKSENKTDSGKKDNTSDSAAVSSFKTILFFGNSLTAGYGLDVSEAFPALIQAKIDSLKLPYKVVNAGLSGETSSGGKNRIDWLLQQRVDVFVLELGANDGLRGIAVKETVVNLQDIINSVKSKYPDAKLIMTGMQVPPNMGNAYATEFRGIFAGLAQKNNMALVPFVLEGVGGVQELNQRDGIHPTAEGHRIVAENIWQVMKGML